MSEKPEAKACPLCGEMIEPYQDGGQWVWSGNGVVAMWVKDELTPYHHDCFPNARLWKRIRAIEHCGCEMRRES